jgi:hypothetical protein
MFSRQRTYKHIRVAERVICVVVIGKDGRNANGSPRIDHPHSGDLAKHLLLAVGVALESDSCHPKGVI